MRLIVCVLLGCASSPSLRSTSVESTPPATETPAAAQPAEGSAVESATRTLVDALEISADQVVLGDAVETLARELADGDEPWIGRLRGMAGGLREGQASEHDARELVQLTIATLWELSHERASRGTADPALCSVVRVLALQGLRTWRAELQGRLEREGVVVMASDYRDYRDGESHSRDGCEHLDEVSTAAGDCTYRNDLVHAHWIAFGEDGPLAAIEAGLSAGPAEAARAIEADIDGTGRLFALLMAPRPQRRQVAELVVVCGG